MCADNNHVRTWTVTRFRGMISTQPGSTPLASFKVLALEDVDGHAGCAAGTDIGRGNGLGGVVHGDVAPTGTPGPVLSPRGTGRALRGARRAAGLHPEGGARRLPGLREAVVHRKEVRGVLRGDPRGFGGLQLALGGGLKVFGRLSMVVKGS